jgi:hypothetical protein
MAMPISVKINMNKQVDEIEGLEKNPLEKNKCPVCQALALEITVKAANAWNPKEGSDTSYKFFCGLLLTLSYRPSTTFNAGSYSNQWTIASPCGEATKLCLEKKLIAVEEKKNTNNTTVHPPAGRMKDI